MARGTMPITNLTGLICHRSVVGSRLSVRQLAGPLGPASRTNYIEVGAEGPTEGRTSVDLMIPVWTPGSYLIREYERNVEAVVARAGDRTLAVDKPVKNRWRVATAGTRAITLTYRVYSH